MRGKDKVPSFNDTTLDRESGNGRHAGLARAPRKTEWGLMADSHNREFVVVLDVDVDLVEVVASDVLVECLGDLAKLNQLK